MRVCLFAMLAVSCQQSPSLEAAVSHALFVVTGLWNKHQFESHATSLAYTVFLAGFSALP